MRRFLVHHSTSIYNVRTRFAAVLITLFLSSLNSIVKAQSADSVKIPAAVRIDQYGHQLPVTYQREFALDVLQQGDDKDVFPGPPCLEGHYYVGLQLEYDLADRNTLVDWKSHLEIAFLHGTDTLWKKPLQVDMKSQTFLATIFHDTLISCDGQYHFYVASKTSTGTVPLENIYLKVLLHKSIEDVFNPTASLDLDCAYTDHKTQLSWKYTDSNYTCDAVIAHDIEWVFIDNYDAFTGSTAVDAFNFTEPIRITTDSSSHYTHQVYYPDGRIWYRIRAVGTNPQYPGHRLVGQWFYSAAIPVTNQQGDLNWQQQTVFAEEGKYKKVISYFDGSLRQRQVLTNLSTEHVTLVGESLYDFEGRQAASILAVPALDAKLAYKANFNVFSPATDPLVSANTSTTQHKFNYDNNRLENTVLSNQTGASKYYSNQNANGGIHSEFIPDAEGYVYSQTEFKNDGTGKISRQSGVGEAFNLEGDHATQYYYGGATQAELVRLFGNNVGKSSHYKKNLVVDPNGQVSVTYLDQEGRTVATALAGESPTNVQSLASLDSLPNDPLVEKISDKNKLEDGVSRTVHTFLNVVPNTVYTFNYDLQALGSQIEALGCKTCTYDLKITITDPDGVALDLSAAAGNQSGDQISYQRKNITAASCTTATVLNDVVIIDTLRQIGDYTITKTLSPAELTFEQMQALVTQDTAYQNTAARINQSYVADPDDCAICTSGPLADQAVQDAINEIAVMDCENIYQQILSYYRNLYPDSADFEPTNEQITQHPLYCKYQLCKQNTASDVFDKTLATKTNWSAAMPSGYVRLADSDPFFNVDSLSGHGYKSSFLGQLNDIQVASVGYDSDGDGEQDGTTNYHGSIENVTDPANTDYYINDNGVHDAVDGRHILYMDIMSKRTELADTSYQKELNKQHWLMYQSFYLNAKRKAKMSIPAYQNCASAMDDLNAPDVLPTHPDSIAAFASAHGVTDSVSTEDIQHQMYALNTACNITFNTVDSTSIANHLKSYFSSNAKNIFRTIIKAEVHSNADLVAINTTLSHYNCNLDNVALDDPLACLKDTVVAVNKNIFKNNSQSNSLLVSANTAINSRNLTVNKIHSLNDIDSLKDVRDSLILNEVISRIETTNESTASSETTVKSSKAQRNSFSVMSVTSTLPTESEYNALMSIYSSLGGSSWSRRSGWETADPDNVEDVSQWYGLHTDSNGHIIGLDLSYNFLQGSLPSELGDLVYLKNLNLAGNTFDGTLPSQIGLLDNLLTLNVSQCHLTSIPSAVGSLSKLQTLNLDQNFLTDLPIEIGSCDSLRILSFSYNSISAVPFLLENFSMLEVFSAGNNNLSDLTSVNGLIHLKNLSAPRNQITHIPSGLGSLIELQSLDLSHNTFNDSLPDDIGGLKALYYVYLNDAQLDGTLPEELGNIDYLRELYLNSNQLSGHIPNSIGNLEYLQSIYLSDNNLTGNIPTTFSNLNNLNWLELDNNKLSGSIPSGLNLYLDYLSLSHNQLTGSIPEDFVNLRADLYLNDNMLEGDVPDFQYSTIENFDFDNNNLSGLLRVPYNVQSISFVNNKFTFSDFIQLDPDNTDIWPCDYGDEGLTACNNYTQQKRVDVARSIIINRGNPLDLSTSIDRNTDPKSKYQWFKFVDGVNDIPLNSQDTASYSYVISNPNFSNSGKYYYTIRNDKATYLTLTSNLITLTVVDSAFTLYDICLTQDTANTTIKKLSYTLDINKEVAACMERAQDEQIYLREYAIDKYLDSKVTDFYKAFQTQCLNQVKENLQYEYVPKEYHYTLYYFDQSAELVQTVPPNGVHPLSTQQVNDFIAGTVKANPAHTLITRYQFSSINQVIWQKTPDAGESNFWYNDKGQLKLSQNAQQANDTLYSYTRYDALGRIVEVGELSTLVSLTDLRTRFSDLNFPADDTDIQRSDITSTHYDLAKPAIQNVFSQQYLRNRVSWVDVVQKHSTDTVSTYYNYDIHGNVKSLQQQLPGFEPKQTQYLYDLISGKVNYVMYQYGKNDQFIHQYSYDSDNRITDVHTSTDGYIFVKEATYSYYLHGPLARVELGQYRVQAQDYYYTLQGWIKGVNTPYVGNTNALDYNAGRDVYAYALGYYENDYKPVNATVTITDTRDQLWSRLNETMNYTGLYNGNLSWTVTDLNKIGEINHSRAKGMQAMLYKYDQLHRIVQSRSLTNYSNTTGFGARDTGASAYDEDYSYDGNGNIMTLQRHNEVGVLADDFIYQYYTNSNKLRQVKPLDRDKVVNGGQITTDNILYRNLTLQGGSYTTTGKFVDIKAQENITMDPNFDAREGSDVLAHIVEDDGTFQYDKIGNLILDQDQGVQITWTPYRKVREVHTKGDSLVVDFKYDGAGNRIEKTITIRKDTTHYATHSTRYLRDAGGNVMAIYKDSVLLEQSIYGSSRLGQYTGNSVNGKLTLGERKYELSSHLGNVLAIITDNINMQADSAWANIVNTSDYYPFGLEMKGRIYNDTTSYRYGFNGKEKDDKGEFGNTVYDYGFRIYNPSIAKFLSVDPLFRSYPWNGTYAFAENDPINFIDLDGAEKAKIHQGTRALIVVIQGWGGGLGPNEGKTQMVNAIADGKVKGPATDGLGSLRNKDKSIQLVQFASGLNGYTTNDVKETIKDFNAINPDGRVVIVGHSLGASNALDVINSGEVKNVELLITLDPASGSLSTSGHGPEYVEKNIFYKDAVKNIINYRVDPGADLGFSDPNDLYDKPTTNGVNIDLVPQIKGIEHTNVDNTIAPILSKYIMQALFGSGAKAVDDAKNRNYKTLPLRYNNK